MTAHLAVVDGNNGAYRFYHAVRDRPPAEAFGFWLSRLIKSIKPTHMVVAFDPLDDSASWRRAILPSYKAEKPPRPQSLTAMLLAAREECRAAGIALAEDAELEADDLIAAYVRAARSHGWSSTIVSSDKDLTQLVRDSSGIFEPSSSDARGPLESYAQAVADSAVRMLDEVRNLTWTESTVRAKLGVEPRLVPDLFALTGDTSDGFKGVPGIGSKIALGLLERYGSLEGVLANKNLVQSDRIMNLLREHEASARACHRVACLRVDRPLPLPLHMTFLR